MEFGDTSFPETVSTTKMQQPEPNHLLDKLDFEFKVVEDLETNPVYTASVLEEFENEGLIESRVFEGRKQWRRLVHFKEEDLEKIGDQIRKATRKPKTLNYVVAKAPGKIYTLEGVMYFATGDRIVHGIYGEMYPVKKDIFHSLYEDEEESKPPTVETATVGVQFPEF